MRLNACWGVFLLSLLLLFYCMSNIFVKPRIKCFPILKRRLWFLEHICVNDCIAISLCCSVKMFRWKPVENKHVFWNSLLFKFEFLYSEIKYFYYLRIKRFSHINTSFSGRAHQMSYRNPRLLFAPPPAPDVACRLLHQRWLTKFYETLQNGVSGLWNTLLYSKWISDFTKPAFQRLNLRGLVVLDANFWA